MLDLNEEIDKLLNAFGQVSEMLRQHDKHLYNQWRVRGYFVTNDIVSMYCNIHDVREFLENGFLEDE